MHESIATAYYRRDLRTIRTQTPEFVNRLRKVTAHRRGPWMRQSRERILAMPSFIPMAEAHRGAGKREERLFFGVFCEPRTLGETEEQWIGTEWIGSSIKLSARTCDVDMRDNPITFTAHVIQRAMQRESIPTVREAVQRFWPAYEYTLLAHKFGETPPSTARLLPARNGGAVLASVHESDPLSWTLITYLHADQLRPDQRAELQAVEATVTRRKEALGA